MCNILHMHSFTVHYSHVLDLMYMSLALSHMIIIIKFLSITKIFRSLLVGKSRIVYRNG